MLALKIPEAGFVVVLGVLQIMTVQFGNMFGDVLLMKISSLYVDLE